METAHLAVDQLLLAVEPDYQLPIESGWHATTTGRREACVGGKETETMPTNIRLLAAIGTWSHHTFCHDLTTRWRQAKSQALPACLRGPEIGN